MCHCGYQVCWEIRNCSNCFFFSFQNFVTEFSAVFTESAFEKEECQCLLNQIICEHFLRQGKLDIAEALNEVLLPISKWLRSVKPSFYCSKIYTGAESLKQHCSVSRKNCMLVPDSYMSWCSTAENDWHSWGSGWLYVTKPQSLDA